MDFNNTIEWLKIIIALVIGFIIIKALLSINSSDEIKCLCDCVEQAYHLG